LLAHPVRFVVLGQTVVSENRKCCTHKNNPSSPPPLGVESPLLDSVLVDHAFMQFVNLYSNQFKTN